MATNTMTIEQGEFIGRSPAIQAVFQLIQKVAFGDASVLISGESGVGKELVARSIHAQSPERDRPLIPVNCGALPATLFESELFGYEKGAFTGAYRNKTGLVELADGGTLFLDEICEMSPELQAKLLRMLEGRSIRRIGGESEIPVNIRILSATNRDIQQVLNSGILREDLFFRISTIRIHIPPLRERREDIPLIATHFLDKLCRKYQRPVTEIAPEAMEHLLAYDWPGNVRELQNAVEQAYYMATPPQIISADLPRQLRTGKDFRHNGSWLQLPFKEAKDRVIESFEKAYLTHQLDRHDWNISRTADSCGIDRRTLHRLINKYRLRQNVDDD